ncbi:MAG: hypothetical protein AAB229_10355 [Candidatus Hydrogenedentota bacterium]
MKAEGYAARIERCGEWQFRVTTYKLGEEYICTVDNVDPGATLARARAATMDEAVEEATAKAKHMLGKIRLIE